MTKRILRTLCVTILGFGIVAPVFAATFPDGPAGSAHSFVIFGSSGSNDSRWSMLYTPSFNEAYCTINVDADRNGTPTDYLRLTIKVWTSGDYDTGSGAVSTDVLGSSLSTSFGTVAFTFPGCYTMLAGTTYGITLTRTGSVDGTNNYDVFYETESPSPVVWRRYSGSWSADVTTLSPRWAATAYIPGSPNTTIDVPDNGSSWDIFPGPLLWEAHTDVDCDLYPDLTGTMHLNIQKEGVPLTTIDAPLTCDDNVGFGYDPAPTYWGYGGFGADVGTFLPAGEYELIAQAEFDGFELGTASSSVFITIVGTTPGGGGGSGGDGTVPDDIVDLFGGGPADITAWATAYPTHDDLYGACDFWTDAMGCLWSWIEYAYIPDSGSFTNILAGPFGLLITRWPFAYVLVPMNAFLSGMNSGTNVCPIPDQFGYSVLGLTTPTFSICDIMDTYSPASQIAANAYMAFVFLTCVWLSFAMLWWRMAQRFLHG